MFHENTQKKDKRYLKYKHNFLRWAIIITVRLHPKPNYYLQFDRSEIDTGIKTFMFKNFIKQKLLC